MTGLTEVTPLRCSAPPDTLNTCAPVLNGKNWPLGEAPPVFTPPALYRVNALVDSLNWAKFV